MQQQDVLVGCPSASQIMRLRRGLFMSQRELADCLDRHDQTVSAWECRRTRMPAALWALMLLIAGRHPHYRLVRRSSSMLGD